MAMETEREKMFRFRNPGHSMARYTCEICDHEFGDEYCRTVKDRGDEHGARECDNWSYRVSVLDHKPEQEA